MFLFDKLMEKSDFINTVDVKEYMTREERRKYIQLKNSLEHVKSKRDDHDYEQEMVKKRGYGVEQGIVMLENSMDGLEEKAYSIYLQRQSEIREIFVLNNIQTDHKVNKTVTRSQAIKNTRRQGSF